MSIEPLLSETNESGLSIANTPSPRQVKPSHVKKKSWSRISKENIQSNNQPAGDSQVPQETSRNEEVNRNLGKSHEKGQEGYSIHESAFSPISNVYNNTIER